MRTTSDETGPTRTEPRRPDRRGLRRRTEARAGRALRVAGDALHVRRAFGEPVRHGDVTIVPVAAVMGGSGAGWGTGEAVGGPGGHDNTGSGGGGGFGVRVRPLGVYVVRGDQVRWEPALDLARVIAGAQAVAAVVALAVAFGRRRRRHR